MNLGDIVEHTRQGPGRITGILPDYVEVKSRSGNVYRRKLGLMEKASVRIRPLRLAFAVDSRNGTALMRVFEANSMFWGGPYNFILPLFKRVPLSRPNRRY
jgi:hypothetical protein